MTITLDLFFSGKYLFSLATEDIKNTEIRKKEKNIVLRVLDSGSLLRSIFLIHGVVRGYKYLSRTADRVSKATGCRSPIPIALDHMRHH